MLTATDRTTAKTITTAAAAYCSEADEEWGIWRAECESLNVAVEAASKDSRALNANLHIVWHISSFWVGRVMFGFGIKYTCAEERTPPHRAPPCSHHGALPSHPKRPPRPDASHLTPPPQPWPDKARCSRTSTLAPWSMNSPEQRPTHFMMNLTNAIALLENVAHAVPSDPTNGDRGAQDHQDRERWLKADRRWWRVKLCE